MLTLQDLWLFLSRLMCRPEAKFISPATVSRFEKLANDWKMLGLYLQEGRHSVVAASTGMDAALDAVNTIRDKLQIVKAESSVLLSAVRGSFPRFYFAEDNDLLHAVAHTSNPQLFSQELMMSVFPGIQALTVSSKQYSISGGEVSAPASERSFVDELPSHPSLLRLLDFCRTCRSSRQRLLAWLAVAASRCRLWFPSPSPSSRPLPMSCKSWNTPFVAA